VKIGTVIYDRTVWDQYLGPSIGGLTDPVDVLAVDNSANKLTKNVASLYNVILSLEGHDVTILAHPDITFDSDFISSLAAVLESLAGSDWGALGIVGRADGGEYIWGKSISTPVEVCTLDSCFIVTRSSLGFTFDESNFDEFHCFVEDYCLQVKSAGFTVMVVPIRAKHHSASLKIKGKGWGSHRKYRQRLNRKWRKSFPSIMTT
jgi:hypothetical protein